VGTPVLTIGSSHTGNFTQGQTGTYTLTVNNNGSGATSGTVTVTDTLPNGLTANSMSGTGWNCTPPGGPCTRSDSLPAGGTYPLITLTVNVSSTAPSSVTNSAGVSGGGSSTGTASDVTSISSGSCINGAATMATPVPGSTLSGSTVTFTWNASCTATDYWLWIGTGGVGTYDVFDAEQGPRLTATVSDIPASGTLYFRLWSEIAGVWNSIDYQYTIGVVPTTVSITVTSVPTGLSVTLGCNTCASTPCPYQLTPGTGSTLSAPTTPEAGATGVQYLWASWSDNGAASHSITVPASPTTYTANFVTQYLLTTAVNPIVSPAAGTIGPATGWFNSGSVSITATANSGYQFSSFTAT